MKDCHIRDTCRLCNGPITKVLDLGETCLANELPAAPIEGGQDKFPLYLSKCDACGHIQLPVVVNPERLFSDYVYRSATSPVFVKHLHELAGDVQPRPGGFVVEIGSNDGTLLAEYKRLGFEVLGVDPAHNIAAIAELENGVPTIRDFFSRATLKYWGLAGRKADLIVALNVFAHADDLSSILEGVAALLAPGGGFVFEVGYLPNVIENGLYRVVYHEHLSYHHLKPLQGFLSRHGLRMYDAELVNTQGGSIRVYVALADPPAYYPVSIRLAKLLELETTESVDVSRLSERVVFDKARIRAIFDDAEATGKTVCGYGAPAQLTTTCAALGIMSDDIAFVVDDNPLKVGKFTPGEFIPIVDVERLVEADICLIFSVNFAEDIIARHPELKGQWVTL